MNRSSFYDIINFYFNNFVILSYCLFCVLFFVSTKYLNHTLMRKTSFHCDFCYSLVCWHLLHNYHFKFESDAVRVLNLSGCCCLQWGYRPSASASLSAWCDISRHVLDLGRKQSESSEFGNSSRSESVPGYFSWRSFPARWHVNQIDVLVPRQPDRVALAVFNLELEFRVRSRECLRSGSEVSVVFSGPRGEKATRFRAFSNRWCCNYILCWRNSSEWYILFFHKMKHQNN